MTKKPESTRHGASEATEELSDADATLRLMGAGGRPEGMPEANADIDFDAGGGSKSVSTSTLVVLLVASIAAGTLYLMRKSGTDTSTIGGKEIEAKIEMALAKLSQPGAMASQDPLQKGNLDKLFSDTDSIVHMFASDSTTRQVPIEFVKKNPFAMPMERTVVVPTATGEKVVVQRQDDFRERKLREELKDLKLQTVMRGRVPVAIINGNFVQVDQKVGSFTLKSIDDLGVKLEADGLSFSLTMEDKNPSKGLKGR